MKKNNTALNVTLGILSVIFILCLIGLAYYVLNSKQEEKKVEDIKKKILQLDDDDKESLDGSLGYIMVGEQFVQNKFKNLYEENKDFIGWITIDDTPIDYPVMYTPDEQDYYLHTNFDKEYSYSGCIFADARSGFYPQSDNIILYGHNMNNGTMFAKILKYEDQEWAESHKYITFDTLYGNYTYEVIAAFRSKIYDENTSDFKYYDFTSALGESDFKEYIWNLKQISSYKTDTTATYGDKLLTLSTCAYHTIDGRFAIVAKQINKEEINAQ